MELVWLAIGLVIGGLLAFFIAKGIFKSRTDDDPIGTLMVTYFDPEKPPNMFLALEVEPEIVARSKRVVMKVKKHVSQK